jgi:hypothetical protein
MRPLSGGTLKRRNGPWCNCEDLQAVFQASARKHGCLFCNTTLSTVRHRSDSKLSGVKWGKWSWWRCVWKHRGTEAFRTSAKTREKIKIKRGWKTVDAKHPGRQLGTTRRNR